MAPRLSMRRRWELAAEGLPPFLHIDPAPKSARLVVRIEPASVDEPDLAPILLLACTAVLVAVAEDVHMPVPVQS